MKALNRRLDILEKRIKQSLKPALIKFYGVHEAPTTKDLRQINKALAEDRIVLCFYAKDMSRPKESH